MYFKNPSKSYTLPPANVLFFFVLIRNGIEKKFLRNSPKK
jgi:hypothetical protein